MTVERGGVNKKGYVDMVDREELL